jgi:hypothetical protein
MSRVVGAFVLIYLGGCLFFSLALDDRSPWMFVGGLAALSGALWKYFGR